MKSFLIITAFLLAAMLSKAQHNHFIYLQADNKQPFYVKVKGNVYSSSSTGYLIIPKLSAGTHELSIGFPKNQWPAQTIPVSISGKDLGYLLKNFESKGWGLFNIQTMDVIMSSTAFGTAVAPAKIETRTDEFSNALADVVNTPSIKEVKEEKKPEPVKKEEPVALLTVPVVTTAEAPKSQEILNETRKAAAKSVAVITKIRSSQTGEASNITYLVSDQYGSDTVDISIPKEKITEIAESKQTPKDTKPVETASAKGTPSPKFIEIDLPDPNKPAEKVGVAETKKEEPVKMTPVANETSLQKKESVTARALSEPPLDVDPLRAPEKAAPMQMINSDCKAVATEDDFMKTRKKMTAQKSDDDMVNAAKKLFRQKCYSTAQVKNLSVLFLKDEGKYKFFDAIYPFVYDSPEFKQLESQLSEAYYISRFKSMIRN